MIFIDSNVPIYLIGADIEHKRSARASVEAAVSAGLRLVTSAEVFQEILYRFHAVQRRDAVQPAFDTLLGLVDMILPVTANDALRAKDVLLGHEQLSARDAIHVAVMEAHDVHRILTFDRGFDVVDGIERLPA